MFESYIFLACEFVKVVGISYNADNDSICNIDNVAYCLVSIRLFLLRYQFGI